MGKIKSLFAFFKQTHTIWLNTQPSRMAAALAFRGIFSLAPVLLIVMIIVTLIFDRQVAITEITDLLEQTMGPTVAEMMEEVLISAAEVAPTGGIVPLLISLGVMLYAATALFYELKLSLNTIWGIPYAQSVGVFNFIKNRLLALAVVLGIGFLFVVLIIINALISLLVSFLRLDMLLSLAGVAASFGLITLVLALIFKLLPDSVTPWRAVWIGAPITSVMLTVGIWGLGIYLALTSVGAAYGAAGALMAILIWLYYSSHIVIVGAALTRSIAIRVSTPPAADTEAPAR